MKTIASVQTYDPTDCTTTGYDVAIRDDGTARITSHSRWQGTRTDVVYIANTPADVMAAAQTVDEDAPDIEAAVREWLSGDALLYARRIRCGYVVR